MNDIKDQQINDLNERITDLERKLRIAEISQEAMAEIKATIDGDSDQPVRDIVYGCISEIKNLPKVS